MATNSSSTMQGDVSYLEAYNNWMLDNKERNKGQFTIPIKDLLPKFALILPQPQYQKVYCQETDEEKIVKLFREIMPANGEIGVKQVIAILFENNNIELANDLKKQMGNAFTWDTTMSKENEHIAGVQLTPLVDPRMVEAQEHLSKFIILNIDFMAEFWSDKLLVANTWSAYADVQILEDFKDDKGKMVYEYDEVFVAFNRILIQGDPGCGKSTYVNKIAVDWAKKHEYLREKFDLVFLISLQTLEVGIEQAIRNLLPEHSIEFVEKYYKGHSSKVLLILDGFDEFPEDSQFYPEVMNMLKGGQTNKMKGDPTMSHPSQYSFFTTIITTRRSHVDKVPTRFHARSLLIKGFDEQSMKLFLHTQNVPVLDEQTDPNLVVLLQNPFFCAIYCSLHYFGVGKSKLEDPYDFVKALVESAVNNEKYAKRITDDEDQLLLLGAFAFQKLNSETLNVVGKLFPMSFLSKMANIFKKKPKHVQRIDTDKIQLGLLIKKKIPAVGVQYKMEFGFPHQLIAEYLAARYFIRSTKSKLKQLQPEKVAQGELSVKLSQLILSSPSSLPFVRFLLFEYLDSHLHDVRNGRELIFRFLTDEFRFICYCKSKSETSKINDIHSLDWKKIDSVISHDSRFLPTLTKCHNLKSLSLQGCNLTTHEVTEVVKLFKENCLPKMTKFDWSHSSNIGSTPDLFTALGNCEQLERLDLQQCSLSTESINQLKTCIDDNCWVKLSQLDLTGNSNIGSTPALFASLGKCKQLERLDLQQCSLSTEAINQLITCIDDNCWVKLRQLDLIGNCNVGSTPALFTALGKCKQLERLDIQQFSLSIELSSIPALFAALGKCKHLETLNLRGCSLSIESINRLTTYIDNCWVKLNQLDLTGNSNVGSTPAVFAALGKCKQLEKLDLRDCVLSIESINQLITCINNCWVKLNQLDLMGNSNVGSTPALFAALGKCKQLERLNLELCSLLIESINQLITCIGNNCWVKLRQLDLIGNCNVGSTPALFAALGKCKQLERLDIKQFSLSIELSSIPALFAALGKCKQLERLNLEQCSLSIESINQLTKCINDNCWVKLSQLDLTGNSNVGSTPALFVALCKCKQLERVDLSLCFLSIESINQLTKCIDDNCWMKLSQLDLTGNNNVGSTPALFAALGKCKQLERLDLQQCSLSIEPSSTPALFAALGKCKHLETLDLRGCSLSIESINRLTTYIDNCWVKLSQLDLTRNSNVGSTPALFAALGKCKQLERLDLQKCSLSIESVNQLTTCIDNCWVKLNQLDLTGNSNVGSTPALFAALGKCKHLERLDLQKCSLSIESINRLTTYIDNCSVKLNQLDLTRNSNVGSIPALFAALGKCKQLERLDLRDCVLSIESINQLITCIDNCWVKLNQLDLTGNSNVGSTPALFAALGKCKQLERLNLEQCSLLIESINQLITCIDDNCWVTLSQLDLSLNSNIGSTPALFASLGKCKQLERLDLQQCSLSTEAINQLITCIDDNCWVKLRQLDLIGNCNVGSTPALFAAFGKCKQLQSLDLQWCDLSIESINQLTTFTDRNCWPNLVEIYK